MERLAPLIAVVGSDGSGKSTLSADLVTWLRQSRPAESAYLGLGSGTLGNRIKALPLIGPLVARLLTGRADRVRDAKNSIPGLPTAIAIYIYSRRRAKKFEAVLELRRNGITIVTDRYPQIEVPGFYDGPGLSAARADGWFVKRIVAKERALYDNMVRYRPTLVVRLHVDLDLAMARKPDHDRALVARKIEATGRLTFGNAPIVDLDATGDYGEELEAAKAAVTAALS